ncbi:MAG: Ig-like domain-containing protein [Bacteroidota bacterium]
MLWRAGLLLLLAVICTYCANPIPPQGGPVDEQPPRIDSTRSTPNMQTNFRPQQIELTFDEWVKLSQPNQQVIISPPIEGFRVSLKKRTVILDFGQKDTLRDNVTYVVQFGEAVQDLTESNPAEDLRFVFSTGPYIDSLQVRGQLNDAYTGEPVEDGLVMLYENLADTAFRTERPFYFGRTDEQGNFLISNIRPGQFQVTALKDTDANYRFSQVTEPIGFLKDPITINADTTPYLNLRLFTEQLPLKLNDVDSSRFGLLSLTFNTNPLDRISWESDLHFQSKYEKDSLLLWYQSEQRDTLYLQHDTTWVDTFRLRPARLASAADKLAALTIKPPATGNAGIYPRRNIVLRASRPLLGVDTSLWTITRDTLKEKILLRGLQLNPEDSTELLLSHNWIPNSTYQLLIQPGGLTDIWQVPSVDSLNTKWRVSEEKRFGTMKLLFETTDSTANYLIRIVSGSKPPVGEFVLTGQLTYDQQLTGLPPGEYQLAVILDQNRNARWDTGNFDQKQQPEPVSIQSLEELRASWEIETNVDLSSLFRNLND